MYLNKKDLANLIKEETEKVLSEKCWDGYERNPDIPKGDRGSCVEKTDEVKDKEDLIPGGLGDNLEGTMLEKHKQLAKKFDVDLKTINKAVEKGVAVEMEHTSNGDIAHEIAMEHIYEDVKYYDKLASIEEEKKSCKPSKGKRFAKRVDGKCRSFGQKGKAKDGGDRIRPGTKKGDAYCARSVKIKKCKNPPCANVLSRKKWKCRGSKSMKEQKETNS